MIEQTLIDKSSWPKGPWQHEPDEVQWTDETTGLSCLIVRNTEITGCLCGYVGVPKSHPLYGKDYNAVDVNVHGGLTYANVSPSLRSPTNIWWFGFDCGHAFDLMPLLQLPAFEAHHFHFRDTYKNIYYVKKECESLALQLSIRKESFRIAKQLIKRLKALVR